MNKKILLLLMLLPLVTSAQTSRTIHVATAGTLSDYISEDEKYQIEELTLTGELNGTDIRFIRNMSGKDYEERYMDVSDPYEDINTAGKLKTLDISNVNIVGGEVYYCRTTGTARYECYSSVDDVISTYMFRGCKLTSIIMPNSVTSIEGSAFADCSRLTSVTIPNSVMSIGSGAFWGCSSLTSITIPNSVTSIEDWAFYDCSGLTTITIPNSVTSIGFAAFSRCSGLTSITIPNSVTRIVSEAFEGCSGLTTIVSEIETPFALDDVFDYGLATLIVPPGKKSVYQNTAGWNKFTNIVEAGQGGIIGCEFEDKGIRYLIRGDNTVSVVSRETKYSGDVILPESVEFNGNTYIVTAIAYNAFSGCSGLTSITLPPSIKKIGESAFDGCHLNSVHISDLEAWCHIIFYEGINEYHSSNPMEYAQHLFLNGVEVKDLIIPNSVTNIGYAAFHFCSSLTSITIPNSVTEIEYHAFTGCSGLTSLTLPNSVTSIGHQAFSLCSGLISIRIPNSVTSIGRGAFDSCSGLTTIVSEIENPFVINDDVFSCYNKDIYATATLVVPPGKKSVYQNTAGWNKFQNIVEVGGVGYEFEYNGIRYKIGENNTVSVVSREARYSGDVVIPEQVTYNGVTYSVTTIGYLGTCTGLLSVTIPPSIKSIATDAFDECDNLTAVNITDIVSWCNISFANNYSNPLSKAHHLFLNGEEVTDLVIPNSVTTIKDYSFWGCSGLTSITIPNNVTSLGVGSFSRCSGLTTIVSEIENPFEISDNVFECSDKDLYATATLIVPAGTKSAYQNTSGWNKFQNIVEASVVGKEFEDNGIRYLIGENNTVSVTSKTEKYTGDVSIPNQVTYNGDNYIVTSIGLSAFEGCEDMTSVSIPGSVTSICNGAFWECSSLKTVVIPDGVSTIGEGAFRNCFNLVSVDIPNSVTSIGSSAFGNCNNLTQITSGIENPFAIDDYVFLCDDKDLYATATLIVPAGKKSAYQNTAGWNKFQNIVEANGGGKEFEANGIRYLIGENNTVSVTSKTEKYTGDVSIPNQVTYNGDNYIVTSIGLSAFEGCEDMTSVSIPGSVTSICNGAFWECSSLKTVVIPDGVSTIGEGAFRNCFNLVSVDIPNSVTSIGSSAFGNCNNLTQITSGIENPFAIDDYVFLCDDKDLYATATLIVPAGKKSAYQNTAGWNKFQNIYHVDGVYTLTYYVDEEEYKSVTYSSGAGITPEPAPTKEGYTFSGWSEIPESMPDYDVTVTGTFTVNKYDLTYKIDGEVYVTYQIEYGTPITPEAEPTKEGYTFSGWSYIPETMPAVEVNVVGSFTINQYTITYVIDGEEYATEMIDFGSKVDPPTPPSKDGFDFAWEEYPETMPAHDITINGAYTTTGILSIAVESGKAKIFTLDGRQVDTLQKGINIIRMDDGTIKKVVLGK